MAAVLVLVLLAGGCFFLAVFKVLRDSDATKTAVRLVEANPEASHRTGHPLKVGRWVEGNISVHNDTGDAVLTIHVSGPQGSGSIYTEESKANGVWTPTTLRFQPDGQPYSAAISIVPAPQTY